MKNDIMENAKILIIDDQPSNLSILSDYLDKFNAEVMLEQDIKVALKLAEKKKPDIILLDIIMPEMNGFEVCEKLKKNPKTKDIPVIFMSALNDTDNIVKGFQAGGVDYIVKPVRQEEVIARITNHLKIICAEKEMREKKKHEAMTVIIGGISHTFNNSLAAILSFAEIALYNLDNKTVIKHSFEKIINICRFTSGIIKKMMSYARGEQDVTKKEANLAQTVREITGFLELSISGDCLLKYELTEGLPPVKGDVNLINQLILNLVINSSEAIGEKKGTIFIRTGRENNSVYLEVEDTGCGIPEEDLEKIFDPFFTTGGPGRGLGLTVVKGIVETHKGIIKIKSHTGKGTSVKIFFPYNT